MSMGIVCSCASEDCAVNGCNRMRQLRGNNSNPLEMGRAARHYAPATPEEIRRIVREEIERAQKAKP